ncbi:MAG: hypothetical protein ABI288_07540 [Ginsengibacter sp.]
MNIVFLITGGNMGNRKKNLQTAALFIEEEVGEIIRSSKFMKQKPGALRRSLHFTTRFIY